MVTSLWSLAVVKRMHTQFSAGVHIRHASDVWWRMKSVILGESVLVPYSHNMNLDGMCLLWVLNSPFKTHCHCIHVWYKSYFMGFCLACSSNSFQFLVGDFNQENVRKCRGSYIISSILICRACPLSAAVQPCSANTGDPSDHYDIFKNI